MQKLSLPKASGRNFQGKITVRHRGGGARRMYRMIDFKRKKDGIAATVVASFSAWRGLSARTPLIGRVQARNAAIAAMVASYLGEEPALAGEEVALHRET